MTTFNDDGTAGIIPETQYHTFSEAGNFFKRRSMGELTTLYCNTSSLPKNLEKLERCINSMNTVVDIIAISESKITKTVNVGFENRQRFTASHWIGFPNTMHLKLMW